MANSIDYSRLIMTEEVGCEMIPVYNDKLLSSLHYRVRRRENARRQYLTKFAAFVSLLLSCTALLLNAFHHRAANNQEIPGGTDHIGSSQLQYVRYNPCAHLTAPSTFNNYESNYLKWEDQLGLAQLREFTYQDGDLIVPRDGMYKVYLQITFRMPGDFNCREDVFVISQTVKLFAMSYQKDTNLLTASDTVYCKTQTETHYWETSPYISGVFKLEAGDKLRVWKDNMYQEMMLLEEDKTFFGAHLI
ncbi:hypothetical protein UPYG_G00186590 [Umbra pygmaea]|uniref:THD domain-containing protein n=1 Tax=Umbra pygmaea TaxID=75934 RepID=A0ABD0XCT1_UMBPY